MQPSERRGKKYQGIQDNGPCLTGCFQGMIFKMLGGNTLAPSRRVGSGCELRVVSVYHPCGKRFSILIGKFVSVVSVLSKMGCIPLLDPLLYLPLCASSFKTPNRQVSHPCNTHPHNHSTDWGKEHSHPRGYVLYALRPSCPFGTSQ